MSAAHRHTWLVENNDNRTRLYSLALGFIEGATYIYGLLQSSRFQWMPDVSKSIFSANDRYFQWIRFHCWRRRRPPDFFLYSFDRKIRPFRERRPTPVYHVMHECVSLPINIVFSPYSDDDRCREVQIKASFLSSILDRIGSFQTFRFILYELAMMTRQDVVYDIPAFLAILNNEEELIIKPLQLGKRSGRLECFVDCFQGSASETGAIECGKVVSRLNKSLFDYQIGITIDFQCSPSFDCLFLQVIKPIHRSSMLSSAKEYFSLNLERKE